MKKKIYRSLMMVSSISIFLVTVLLLFIFNNFYINNKIELAHNIFPLFLITLPAFIIIIALIFIISSYLSSVLSDQILKPINYVGENIERLLIKNELDTLNIYDELLPFVKALIFQSEKIKHQLEDIAQKNDITKTIISNMKEGLIFVDNKRDILSINKSAIEILEGNEAFNYKSKSFITICRNSALNLELDKVLEEGNDFERIIELNGRYIYFFINKVFSEDKSLGVIILMFDYTQKHKLDLIRKEFSSNVSHELKTPLTSINGYAEMIETGIAKGEDIKKFASIIRDEGLRLLELINSIIKLSKIEDDSYKRDFSYKKDFEDVNLYSISIDVIEKLKLIASEKNIDLKLIGSDQNIKANKVMIKELLYNLIENAIKYTPNEGKVTIEILNDSNFTVLKVKDTGIGISKEDQKRIFERFFMVDKSRTKNKNSTGLGLSIVKHIIEYHNFKISLISEIDRGSQFIIYM
ncbi:sensor histidine kinase [Tissierella creatinophila]|uniref:histidine kinase n=1 Tax=Tissierella creatinophila DSM 6911 TaxID=1123403 RepID=A0A1U7M7X4_TISCR|nr:ATP-binding protein [Tissierella creatinophila]OLS03423.1 alkaline phosphatase synthesis sensor protein PhoR [Tissierella creatinophila DSM 6911]